MTDFGLAKAADQQDLTHTGDVLGTLRYMAPEQFDGKADARSDVYSLGLTLYEMLALKPSFDEKDRHKLIKQVTEAVPARLRTLDPHIPRDLETIVHKAIDRDPSHRYQTAGDLAADLQRYLGDEPIRARWVSPITRFQRWCKRNPMGAMVVALLLILAVGGPLMAVNQARLRQAADDAAENESTAAAEAQRQRAEAIRQGELAKIKSEEADEQRQRAEENLRKAREAVDRLFTKAADDLNGTPHMEMIRKALLEDALEFYESFLEQKSNDPVLRLETAHAYSRVGQIHSLLGRHLEAVKGYSGAAKLIRQLQAEFPQNVNYREQLLKAYSELAGAQEQVNALAEADQHRQKVSEILTELAREFPENPAYRTHIIRVIKNRGNANIVKRRRYQEAEKLFRQAIRELDRFEEDFPDVPRDNKLREQLLWALGKVLFFSGYQTNAKEAEQAFRDSLDVRKRIAEQSGQAFSVSYFTQYYLSALALLQNRPEEAEELSTNAVKHYQRVIDSYPNLAHPKGEFDKHSDRLMDVLIATGRFQEAIETGLRRVENVKQRVADSDGGPGPRVSLGWAHYELGNAFYLAGDEQRAAENYRAGIELLEQLAEDFPDVPRHQGHLAQVLSGCPLEQFRLPQQAIKAARAGLQLSPTSAEYWCFRGNAQYWARDYQGAIDSLERAIEISGPHLAL